MAKNPEEPHFKRSHCAVANGLDLFGDKWTLLVVRDLLLGKSRYGEFAQSEETIPTNILSSRLKSLEEAGVVEKRPYCEKPLRYEYALTAKGQDLKPVLEAMATWAKIYVPGSKIFPRWARRS